jgi:hypothetical protein
MPNHTKVSGLSDAAFRLHVTAMAWSVEELSDGRIAAHIPGTLPKAPRNKATLRKVLEELADAGLWELQEDGSYVIHDFLKYNPSAAQSKAAREAKVAAGAAGGRAKAGNGHGKTVAPASDLPKQKTGTDVAGASENSSSHAGARARSDSDSETQRELPPTPSDPEQARVPPKDPFGDTLRKFPPAERPDVLRVWQAFKAALGYPAKTKFRGLWDEDAVRIADAIDAYDEATCLGVVGVAPLDSMVNGTGDERGQKHDSVLYVFGNQNTFNRLLRAAEKAAADRPMSVAEATRQARMA